MQGPEQTERNRNLAVMPTTVVYLRDQEFRPQGSLKTEGIDGGRLTGLMIIGGSNVALIGKCVPGASVTTDEVLVLRPSRRGISDKGFWD